MKNSFFHDPIFRAFAERSPVATMTQMVLRRLLAPEHLERLFHTHAQQQYHRTLLFSDLTGLLSGVVLGKFRSVNSGYKMLKDRLGVSITAVYEKAKGIEPSVIRELVRCSYDQTVEICKEIGCVQRNDVPGYQTRILDGNWLSGTEHRLKETRHSTAAPLPGKSLVVYDPRYESVCDCIAIEDAYAQELSGLDAVIETVERKQLWLADRNFCTLKFLYSIASAGGVFVIRQHGKLHGTEKGELRKIGESDSGIVYEQELILPEHEGQQRTIRRVVVDLYEKTRNKDVELVLLTNLPEAEADAMVVAELYRKRWKIETAFGHLTTAMKCEIKPMCYPKAALFCFACALVAYNALSITKGAVAAEHGRAERDMLSHYYLALEIAETNAGMLIVLPTERWDEMQEVNQADFASEIRRLARGMDLSRYRKAVRGPKKKPPKRTNKRNSVHVSSKRILDERRKNTP